MERTEKWLIGGIIAAGILFAALTLYFYSMSQPVTPDSLKISVEQIYSFNQEAALLIEQHRSGKTTDTYYVHQIDQLLGQAQSELNDLSEGHPASGIEQRYGRAQDLFRVTRDLLEQAKTGITEQGLSDRLNDNAAQLLQLTESL